VDGTLLDADMLQLDQIRAITIVSMRYLPGERMLSIFGDIDISNPQSIEAIALRALVVDADGDTVWTHRTHEVKMTQQTEFSLGGMTTSIPTPIPYVSPPDIIPLPNGGVLVSPGATGTHLERYGPDGILELRIDTGFSIEAPTQAEKTAYIDGLHRAAQEDESGTFSGMYETMAENAVFPDRKSPWGSVSVDDSGYIWLASYVSELSEMPGMGHLADQDTEYRLLSQEGEYLGSTTVPGGSWRRFRSGKLLLQRTDEETGGVLLQVYEIRPVASGLVYP
jgi:hypothetical protein